MTPHASQFIDIAIAAIQASQDDLTQAQLEELDKVVTSIKDKKDTSETKFQRFITIFPDPNDDYTLTFLNRDDDGKVRIMFCSALTASELLDDESVQLTIDEINADFEWAAQFAKPVDAITDAIKEIERNARNSYRL